MTDPRGAYLGAGKIYLADVATPDNLIFIGNCSSLDYEAETQEIPLQDYTTPGGGLDKSVQRVSAVNISYNARHFNKANIARAHSDTATSVIAWHSSKRDSHRLPRRNDCAEVPTRNRCNRKEV